MDRAVRAKGHFPMFAPRSELQSRRAVLKSSSLTLQKSVKSLTGHYCFINYYNKSRLSQEVSAPYFTTDCSGDSSVSL